MNDIQLFRQLVSINDNQPVTTSRKIAKLFGKRHSDVVRAINELDCSDDFRERSYALSQYDQKMPTGGNKSVNEFLITKDGMTFLVMGFKGKEAAKFKESYINAFNWMTELLQNRQEIDFMLNDFSRRESNSVSSGSFHGLGLAKRKTEKQKLAAELEDIQSRLQIVIPLIES